MRRTLIAFAAGMMLASQVFGEAAPKTFELNEGRFTELPSTNPGPPPKPDPALKRVETLIDRRSFSSARREALAWLLAHKRDDNRGLGLYLMAQAENGSGNPLEAFYYCDELLDTYPASPYYPAALELQYQLGDSLFNGRKLKLLGVPMMDGTDEGIEMMFRIQQRSPGSPIAERALRRTADYYFADGQFDLAADAYGAHAKAYPRNPNLPEILLRQAFANYAQFTGLKYDPTPLVNARSQMVELVNKYPEVAQRENIPSFVESIDKTLARKLFQTADFYRRTHKPTAEKQVLEVLVKEYPQTDEAQQARRMLGS